ncbi:translesion DNA synthesis-associated protein ImuA [Shewanella cyperi]|uniref:Translesion DNA synthesis-associated protein ImuA n=1 Tax=Shewanella cyperi TaxID=2814292 RepID=A0A974XNC4_9GAMM|nr:translesion DNA synthesis-associated protein ImuA [Shewanella cyperi]QSX31595.1 translesion DNA synthesis-associated protein ImuA [Shewanella cyperi]
MGERQSVHALPSLLARQDIWVGQEIAPLVPGHGSGFDSLDALLPDRGWPRQGVCELICSHPGLGELALLSPLLATLSRQSDALVLLVAPSLLPVPQYLLQQGIAMERLYWVDSRDRKEQLWAMEQALSSGGCQLVLAWLTHLSLSEARRLQLASEKGQSLGIVCLPSQPEAHPVPLKLALEPGEGAQVRLRLLKRRGGAGEVSLNLALHDRLLPANAPVGQLIRGPWG